MKSVKEHGRFTRRWWVLSSCALGSPRGPLDTRPEAAKEVWRPSTLLWVIPFRADAPPAPGEAEAEASYVAGFLRSPGLF